MTRTPTSSVGTVLVIVQNLPLPGDRRVWLECQALVEKGYEVVSITPRGMTDPGYELLDGVHMYKYVPPRAAKGFVTYVWEFIYCWLATARLSITAWHRHRFQVIQACNPPDTFFLLAALYRPLGVRFVFDQHDLCPEVYLSRFDRPRPIVARALLALEKATYRTADAVISTNESYRQTALGRGGVDPDRVTVVRTGPDDVRMSRGTADTGLRRGREHLVTYVGVMGPQDAVHVVVEAVAHAVFVLGHTDTTFAVLGSGDSWSALRRSVTDRGLDDFIYMPGRVSDEELFAHLSTSDLGLCPDLPGPLNDVSTMNKTLEYMAFEVPFVAFDLPETKVSGGGAGVYVSPANADTYAAAIVSLLADTSARARMGAVGRERVVDHLAWRHSKSAYVGVYDSLRLGRKAGSSGADDAGPGAT